MATAVFSTPKLPRGLTRMKLEDVQEGLKDLRVELAQKAQSLLGYSKLAQAIATPEALLFRLRELGIMPLSDARVNAYMDSKAKSGMWSGTKWTLACFAATLVCAAMVVFGYNYMPFQADWPSWLYTINIIGFVGTCGFAIASMVARADIWGEGTRKFREWHSFSLANYRGSVPEFVLDHAVSIKTAMPGARFDVVQLEEETVRRKTRPLPDPFLRVTLGTETYYIDVWDEKEFESRM